MTTAVPHALQPGAPVAARNVIAIASGKGGVGKTWLAITLAHALARLGRHTLLFDGDLGLANVDIQLGLMPDRDLGGVLAGRLSLAQAILRFDTGGFDIIAGRSGCGRLAGMPHPHLAKLCAELISIAAQYQHVVLDLGAGLERTVRELTRLAGCCIVVTTDEPTSLTDAYAFIKIAQLQGVQTDVRILVNMATSLRDGEKTYGALLRACESFLKVSPPLLGVIRRDFRVRQTIRSQSSLLARFPNCVAAADVEQAAARLAAVMSGTEAVRAP